MLSYQHIYHAGNLADVHKHAVLSLVLELLIAKDKPLSYLETHSGRGLYDLRSVEAQKTGEYKTGVEHVLSQEIPSVLQRFVNAVLALRKEYGAHVYPGSPALAHEILRREDQLHLMELHPQEVQYLRGSLQAENVHIHHRDGYEGVLAITPPTPRRGLVFIDPSYEVKKEYAFLIDFIQELHGRWPQANIVLWYPVLKEALHVSMRDVLCNLGIPKTFYNEFHFANTGLLGSGMLILNAPYRCEEVLEPLVEALQAVSLNDSAG